MLMIKSYAAIKKGGPLKEYLFEAKPLNPKEVRIQVHTCGICHSDLSAIDNDWGKSNYPMVAGHEVIGEIIEIGKEV